MDGSTEESPDQVLDLRKSNAAKHLCIWCNKKKVVADLGIGDEFCSEICFEQYRRDSFKKRSACMWCSNNNGHGIVSTNFTGTLDESKFCSDYCLAQFKVRLFCEETSSHLDQLKDVHVQNGQVNSGNFQGPVFNPNNKDLITPDLWLRKSTSVYVTNDPNNSNNKRNATTTNTGFSGSGGLLDTLFTCNEHTANSALSPPRNLFNRQGDQLSPSSCSVTSSRRPSSPGSNSIHSLSPMPSPASGPQRKRTKPNEGCTGKRGGGQGGRGIPKEPKAGARRGRKNLPAPPPQLIANHNGPHLNKANFAGTGTNPLAPQMHGTEGLNHPFFRQNMMGQPPNFDKFPIPNGQGQESMGHQETRGRASPNDNARNRDNPFMYNHQRLENMLPKIVLMIPYPIPFPIPFPVRSGSMPTMDHANVNNNGQGANGGEARNSGSQRVLHQLDETD